MDWMTKANCRDLPLEAAFSRDNWMKVQERCQDCVVREECLQQALNVERQFACSREDVHGVFGGMTALRRWKLIEAERRSAACGRS